MNKLVEAKDWQKKVLAVDPKDPEAAYTVGVIDWTTSGYDLPLLVNMQPAGQYLSERFHRAGGVPAVMWELLQAGKIVRSGGPELARELEREGYAEAAA